MHFFSTCDSSRLEEGLESALRQLRALKADHDDLWERFARLQGRMAKRGELTVTPREADGNGGLPVNEAIINIPRQLAIARSAKR